MSLPFYPSASTSSSARSTSSSARAEEEQEEWESKRPRTMEEFYRRAEERRVEEHKQKEEEARALIEKEAQRFAKERDFIVPPTIDKDRRSFRKFPTFDECMIAHARKDTYWEEIRLRCVYRQFVNQTMVTAIRENEDLRDYVTRRCQHEWKIAAESCVYVPDENLYIATLKKVQGILEDALKLVVRNV